MNPKKIPGGKFRFRKISITMKRLKFLLLVSLLSFTLLVLFSETFRNRAIVVSMIFGGKILGYDEASSILYNYCFTNIDSLELSPDHLRKCPVILTAIKNMKAGETRVIKFKQSECWRISYALSAITIKRTNNSIILSQFVDFDRSGRIYTYLNLCGYKVKIYDSIVHCFYCHPFVAYSKFSILKI